MTKLIDADEFIGFMTELYKVAGWDEREVHFSLADLKTNLDFEKTVEAIPIEFIEQYTYRHGLYTCAMEVISAWRTTK